MTTYNDVFGTDTIPPGEFGYASYSFSSNLTLVWSYNTSGGDSVAKIMEVSASAGSLSITLPDATQVSTGEDFLIRNVGSYAITIKDSSGSTVGTLATSTALFYYLKDNSTAAGTWAQVTYGAGTSSVDAATLVGYGIKAISASLSQSHPVYTTAAVLTIGTTLRAQMVNYTGGTGTIAFSAVATLGDDFFVLIKNSGTGTLTLDPNSSELIDGASSITMQPGESTFVVSSGAALYTVGLGRSLIYNFTQLVLDVGAAGTFTLSAAQASNKLLTFIGAPTSAVTVQVPATVSVYYAMNALSTSQNVTVKVGSSTGTTLAQSVRAVLLCDASDVYSATTATVTSVLQMVDGSASAPALSFASQTNTGIYKYSTTGIGIAVGGVARFTDDGTTSTIGALSGLIKRTAGVESAATAGTDYAKPDTASSWTATQTFDANLIRVKGSSTGWTAISSTNSGASNYVAYLPGADTRLPIASYTITFSGLSSARTVTLPDANISVARIDAGQTFVGTQTVLAAATQDAVALAGRAGGTSSYAVTLTPTTLTGNRTLTLQDSSLTVAGTDVAQNYTAPQRAALTTDNDLSFDLSAKQNFKCTPTAGGALTFTNIPDGLSGSIILINGSNYAITAAATTKISATALSRVSATGTYRIDFITDGTNVYCTASESLA